MYFFKDVSMNDSLRLSIEYANQRSYLDDLFKIYPTIPEGIRSVDQAAWISSNSGTIPF